MKGQYDECSVFSFIVLINNGGGQVGVGRGRTQPAGPPQTASSLLQPHPRNEAGGGGSPEQGRSGSDRGRVREVHECRWEGVGQILPVPQVQLLQGQDLPRKGNAINHLLQTAPRRKQSQKRILRTGLRGRQHPLPTAEAVRVL